MPPFCLSAIRNKARIGAVLICGGKTMEYKAKFEKALDIDKFCGILGENKNLHDLHYERTEVERFREQLEGKLPHLKLIVLTEPWCGDSIAVVPTLLRLLEKNPGVEIRFLLRDENPDLMELFLTNGSRSIPKIIILDDDYRLLGYWGPRPKVAQDIFESYRADINAGKVNKKEAIKKIRSFYSKDKGHAIAEDLSRALLEAVNQD
jgi:thiol-disulfide isomerase/thioredoxin